MNPPPAEARTIAGSGDAGTAGTGRRWFLTRASGLAAALLLAPHGGTAQDQKSEPAPTLDPRSLVRGLRNGGYVIYFRHAATDQSQEDSDRIDLKNCATQRNLSEKGREQARSIGKVFTALGIRVSDVMSSPYCRCVDTAKLAFGEVRILRDLEFAIAKSETESRRLGAVLHRLLATTPRPGTNTVLVAHSANLKEAVGVWPRPEGVAHVFQPQDGGRAVHIARVGPEEWQAVAHLR
jgi:phosphohistidine phosphatase SixA